MKQAVKDYLSYSRKETIGLLSFVMLLILMDIVPALIPEPKNSFTEIDFNKSLDSMFRGNRVAAIDSESADAETSPITKPSEINTPRLFSFDPNTISDADWIKLGVKEKTVATINKYKQRGGVFKKPEDLLKLYGLSDELKQALLPYVKINRRDGEMASQNFVSTNKVLDENEGNKIKNIRIPIKLNINDADSAEWERLPGIGAKLAARIVKFRDRLGGYATIIQVGEVYGIADSTFQKIKSSLTGGGDVKKLHMNSADEHVLAQHPYIQYKLARLIIQYRKEHGPFKGAEDLYAIAGIQSDVVNKLRPYLEFSD